MRVRHANPHENHRHDTANINRHDTATTPLFTPTIATTPPRES
jgi:hypothetical protein